MKFLILVSIFTLCSADVSSLTGSGYNNAYTRGPSSSSFGSLPRLPNRNNNRVEVLADNYVPQTYRHVYVYAVEDEPQSRETKVIRVAGGDKHVNIIFVKAPSQSSAAQTEVVLPEQDEQKNLVYVLLKNNDAESNVKVTRPQSRKPSKPEVHFIRYAENAVSSSDLVEQPPAYLPPDDAPVVPSGLYETPKADVAPPPPKVPSGLYGTPNQ